MGQDNLGGVGHSDWCGEREILTTPAVAAVVELLRTPSRKSARDMRCHKQGLQLEQDLLPDSRREGGSISCLLSARFIPHWHTDRTRLRASVMVTGESEASTRSLWIEQSL
jgi:hypothetical protein